MLWITAALSACPKTEAPPVDDEDGSADGDVAAAPDATEDRVSDAGAETAADTPTADRAAVDTADDADVGEVPGADVMVARDGVECPSPLLACNDRCTDPRDDRENCGGCGRACGDGRRCIAGACA